MDPDNITRFTNKTEFSDWLQSMNSSMLILTGINNMELELKVHSWLSPLAMHVINRLIKEDEPVAFQLFHPRERGIKVSLSTALPEILMQLVGSRYHKLGKSRLAVEAYAQAFVRLSYDQNCDQDTKLGALRRLIIAAMKVFGPGETVFIVLDRVDLCHDDDRGDMMRLLGEMMSEVDCTVKILAISQRTGDWLNEYEVKAAVKSPAVFRHVSVHQGGCMW